METGSGQIDRGRSLRAAARAELRRTRWRPRPAPGARGGPGILGVFDRVDQPQPFGPDDLVALESFGTSAANAIASARAREDERLSLSIASAERERRRWARELHDETLQELGALNVMQESALHSGQTRFDAGGARAIERASRTDHLRPSGADHRAAAGGARSARYRGGGRGSRRTLRRTERPRHRA